MSPALPLATPLALKALVVALLVTSSVQAWQILAPSTSRPVPPAGPALAPANNTTPPAGPVPAEVPLVGPPAPPGVGANETPMSFTVVDPPKYRLSTDFKWEFAFSSTPHAVTPWTGNGPPYLVVQFHGLGDPGMLLNAWVLLHDFKGWNLCNSQIVRYWTWSSLQVPAASPVMLYSSTPVPENPYNLLGSGENCYTRAFASSSWDAQVCMEGDGSIAKARQESGDNGTTIHYVDYMDYCLDGKFSGPL